MYPTVTVEHLSSVTTAKDDSDDMKIYQFDREASMDYYVFTWASCSGGSCIIGSRYTSYDEVLAA
ncbi:hypothetical protein SAMN04488564_107253 [Lentzea waywayandensis]|uniref:Uncharacterized protein n=1 Tax=Lentzea waywayandensis TaxID=84724 RepID=A0A1I6F247_9PSEU|nr:hypothetical protein [Lentzea waywayandensis]SFR23981.1 hypothetical protein SAMN04488564_107253 [Lentzea waywayandensis]